MHRHSKIKGVSPQKTAALVPFLLEHIGQNGPKRRKKRDGCQAKTSKADKRQRTAGRLQLRKKDDNLIRLIGRKEVPDQTLNRGKRPFQPENGGCQTGAKYDGRNDRNEDLEGNGLGPQEDLPLVELSGQPARVIAGQSGCLLQGMTNGGLGVHEPNIALVRLGRKRG